VRSGSVAGSSVIELSMTDVDTTAAGQAGPVPPHPGSPAPARRPRRWPTRLVIAVVVLAVVWWGLGMWSVNYYAVTPGNATPVAPFITVPPHLDHSLTGQILLTDVYVTPLTAQSYLWQRFVASNSDVVPNDAILDPSTQADQYTNQGYLDMAQAQNYATAAALTHLGYTVHARNTGALVYGTALRGRHSGWARSSRPWTGWPPRRRAPWSTRCTATGPAPR
jgi:hypothetical protein